MCPCPVRWSPPRCSPACAWPPQVDWDKWVDEDEEEEAADPMGGFDLSALQNFQNFGAGGMGGMGGMGERLQWACKQLHGSFAAACR